jgi:hypothetical protein
MTETKRKRIRSISHHCCMRSPACALACACCSPLAACRRAAMTPARRSSRLKVSGRLGYCSDARTWGRCSMLTDCIDVHALGTFGRPSVPSRVCHGSHQSGRRCRRHPVQGRFVQTQAYSKLGKMRTGIKQPVLCSWARSLNRTRCPACLLCPRVCRRRARC